MSMQVLNQLVARSITDPSIVHAFSEGQIGEVIADLDFSTEIKTELNNLSADTWAEFSVMAYRLVKVHEPVRPIIDLPSPAEGLISKDTQREKEQVA